MRTLLTLSILAILSTACKKDQGNGENVNSDIEGSWKLIERLSDPGDGSGTFQPTSDNKLIDFDANGTFECNANTCYSGIGGGPSTGTYNATNLTLSPNGCAATNMEIRYTISSDTLVISYPCIEPCREKFIKQ